MTAFRRFFAKELTEIRRTWRLPTVGGVLLFFGVMSPLAALATPMIVESVTAAQPGVVIRIPDPTYLDSYAQWIKNLTQIGLMLVVFASAGMIANERSSGTAVLVVTKPVSRSMFAVAKYAAQAALVTAATLAGTAATWLGTLIAFGEAPAGRLFAASAAWLLGALLAVAVVEALSAAVPTLAAGIMGLVVWALAGVVAIWEPATRFTPVGLLSAPGEILAGESVSLAVPALTAVATIAALVWAAGRVFSAREL